MFSNVVNWKRGLKWKSLMIERVFIFNVNDEDSLSLSLSL